MFSFWPEVMKESNEFETLQKEGCLINPDLSPGALAVDPTTAKCRDFIWDSFVKPRYFDKGITTYWLDETDGEGTARVFCIILAGCCRRSSMAACDRVQRAHRRADATHPVAPSLAFIAMVYSTSTLFIIADTCRNIFIQRHRGGRRLAWLRHFLRPRARCI